MTNEEKQQMLHNLAYEQRCLERIEAGQDPHAQTLSERSEQADWRLRFVLQDILPALPKEVRAGVQECLHINAHIWSLEYLQAYYAQQKTSSSSLPTQS
jgi:hypothetical protein